MEDGGGMGLISSPFFSLAARWATDTTRYARLRVTFLAAQTSRTRRLLKQQDPPPREHKIRLSVGGGGRPLPHFFLFVSTYTKIWAHFAHTGSWGIRDKKGGGGGGNEEDENGSICFARCVCVCVCMFSFPFFYFLSFCAHVGRVRQAGSGISESPFSLFLSLFLSLCLSLFFLSLIPLAP